MGTAEQILDELRHLPPALQQEVLDFAHFLRKKNEGAEEESLILAQQTSLQGIWDNQDDEAWNDVSAR
ncbi:DUF2281 domain-containing protein [Halomonas sp.]|uniref:DUF2281 domain-containing protein n=1 Tax=Halomonas sp. TaxID=1486246 RepID=UPI00298EA355|nr:DUF2281 domain-containing protein [Halomonas sp.]MDW7746953.1 DUF2281 domain-containing protein [Halomonas sp.]